MLDFIKIDAKILGKRVEPSGDLLDWMINNNLNINRYYMLSMPRFKIFYIKESKIIIETYLVYERNISDVYNDMKYLESITDKIFIFHNDLEPFGAKIRICPFLDDNNLRQYLRGKKLERVLKYETGL